MTEQQLKLIEIGKYQSPTGDSNYNTLTRTMATRYYTGGYSELDIRAEHTRLAGRFDLMYVLGSVSPKTVTAVIEKAQDAQEFEEAIAPILEYKTDTLTAQLTDKYQKYLVVGGAFFLAVLIIRKVTK